MDNRDLIRNQVDVSLKLAKQVFSTEANGDSNLVFSPLSINLILSLTTAGANGPMRDQLLAFLNSNSTDDLNTFYAQIVRDIFADGSAGGGPRLSMANGAWVEQTTPLKPSFKHVAESVYNAVYESVDFKHKASEVAKKVNLWVEKETRGLIKQILSANAVSHITRLVLANALYFKGSWTEDQFDADMTEDREFHLLNGKSIKVPFMESNRTQIMEEYNGFKALKLPYEQGEDNRRRFSMYIFLPNAKDGLPSLIDKACSNPGFIEQHLPKYATGLDEFGVPKFKICFNFEASEALKKLGLGLPFLQDEGEGLTEMVEGNGLFVSKIYHKSFIEVNEDGTEAAAATVDEEVGCSMYPAVKRVITFVADHPFLFFIREDFSGVIFFIGAVFNPEQ